MNLSINKNVELKQSAIVVSNTKTHSLRNLAITLLVASLLLAAASITVWHLGVGGTGEWITWTLGGVSALVLGCAIAAMVSYYKESKEPAQKEKKKYVASSSLKTRVSKTVSQTEPTPSQAQPKPSSSGGAPVKLPSAEELRAEGWHPGNCDEKHEMKTYIEQAIEAQDETLVSDYLTQFPWKFGAFGNICVNITSKTPKSIVKLVSDRLLALIKEDNFHTNHHMSVSSRSGGVFVVTLEIVKEAAKKAPTYLSSSSSENVKANFRNLLLGYPNKIDADQVVEANHPLSFELKRFIETHNETIERKELERLCKEDKDATKIIAKMKALKLEPRQPFTQSFQNQLCVFELLIMSGHVECIRAFIEQVEKEKPFFILETDLYLARDKMFAYLHSAREAQQKRKGDVFDALAKKIISKSNPQAIKEEFLLTGLTIKEEAVSGLHKGKTLLQIAVEADATDCVTILVECNQPYNSRIEHGKFYLGNTSEATLKALEQVSNYNLDRLKSDKQSNIESFNALKRCSELAHDPKNRSEILQLMDKHAFSIKPDTVFSGMTFKTPLEVAYERGMGDDLYKTFVVMMEGTNGLREFYVGGKNIADVVAIQNYEQHSPQKGISLFQKAVEKDATEIVNKLVPFIDGPIDTTHFCLGDCSPNTLLILSKGDTAKNAQLKTQKENQAGRTYCLRYENDLEQLLKDMDFHNVKPDDLVFDGKLFIEMVAEQGESRYDHLCALVTRLNGKKVLPKAKLNAYPQGTFTPKILAKLDEVCIQIDPNSKQNEKVKK